MNTLLYYLLQVIATSGILYGYYHLVLRNNKFHKYNRFYLLAATVISIAVPFLNIPVYFSQTDTDSSIILQTLTVFSSSTADETVILSSTRPTHTNWFTSENILYTLYILAGCIMLVRIFISLFKIRRIVKNNTVEQLDKIHFVTTDEPGTPFSFFRWLFWNKKIELQSEKGEQIFRHELFHIEQKHSWDTIYMEFLTVIFWINPFFHLMKKETKAIHEFLADQFAVTDNTKWQYAELLVMQVLNTQQHLVQPFFNTQIKRRIAMITTSKKPSHQYLRKVMTLPLLAMVAMLFAFTYKKVNESEKNSLENNQQTATDTIPKEPGLRKIQEIDLADGLNKKTSTVTGSYLELQNNDGKIIFQADSVVFKSNAELSENTFGKALVVINGEKQAENFSGNNGQVIAKQAVVYDKNNIEAINKYGDAAKNGVIEFTDATFLPDGRLIVINGVIQSQGKAVLESMSPNSIQSVAVLKGNSAIAKYGQKGANGVIEITTKDRTEGKIYQEVTVSDTTRPVSTDNKIFDRVEIEPAFPGGEAKWRQYLEKSLDASVPVKQKAPDGAYTVIVQFIVKTDGFISDVKTLTRHGYGMEQEAMRVIKSGPKWLSAIQNGHIVNAYKKQPITFVVGKGDKHFPGTAKTGNELNEVVVVGYGTKKDNNTNSTVSDVKDVTVQGYQTKNDLKEVTVQGYQTKNDLKEVTVQGYQTKNDVKEVTVQGYQTKNDVKEVTVQGYQTKNDLKEVVVTGYATKKDNSIPTFPGGKEAWQKYLMVNANASVAVDSGAPAGIYKTLVRFIVHTDGSITDIKAITKNGYGTEKEAIRIISKGPKWIPATKNGKAINAYVEQPITFQVEEELNSPVIGIQKTSSSNEKATEKTGNIYPNPANNIVSIPLSSQIAGTALVQVVDIAGNISLTQRPALSKGSNSITINTSTLKPGAYIVNVINPDGSKRNYKMIRE